MSEDIEVLKHKAVHKGELCFEGLYIDKRKVPFMDWWVETEQEKLR